MSRPLIRLTGALTAVVAALGLAACGGSRVLPGACPSRSGSATSRTSPTPRRSSPTRRASSPSTSARPSWRSQTFNAGPAAMEALKSGAIDATYVGPGPGHQRLHQLRRRGDHASSPARPPAARRSWSKPVDQDRRRPQGQEGRHPAARQHPGHRAPLLAQAARAQDRHRRAAATSTIAPQDNAQTLDAFKPGRHRRARGCRSPTPPGWSKAAARCSSTSATCGRAGSS